jgi:hypothetical protein
MSATKTNHAHDAIIGEAYARGLTDARDAKENNPYFQNTELFIAYAAGYQNRTAWMASNN